MIVISILGARKLTTENIKVFWAVINSKLGCFAAQHTKVEGQYEFLRINCQSIYFVCGVSLYFSIVRVQTQGTLTEREGSVQLTSS